MKNFLLNNFFFIKLNFFNLINVILKKILLNKILMVSWINYECFFKIILKKNLFYFSRNKNYFWFKGMMKSFCFQMFKSIYIDCDNDVIIIEIFQIYNNSCHTNYYNCFFNKIFINKI